MGTLAIVQARMSSRRLPGKSLADVCGEPMLALLLRRLSRARTLGEVAVATSDEELDAPIASLATDLGFRAERGSRDDVLGRFVSAMGDHDGAVVRITGDCPLIDADVVDRVVELFHAASGCAYASNIEPRTFPDGLDVEVIAADALRDAAARFSAPEDREHVTMAVRRDPERYPAVALMGDRELGHLRWTVDNADDLEFVRAVVSRLGARRYDAGMDEILEAVVQEPSLAGFGAAERAC